MSISQAKLKGNLGAIADYFLEVDADLGDYYLAGDGEPDTAPPRALGTLAERLGLTGEVTAVSCDRSTAWRSPGAPTAHTTETDFGAEAVWSTPATRSLRYSSRRRPVMG